MNDLGLGRAITRRDFLDGVRIAVTGSIVEAHRAVAEIVGSKESENAL